MRTLFTTQDFTCWSADLLLTPEAEQFIGDGRKFESADDLIKACIEEGLTDRAGGKVFYADVVVAEGEFERDDVSPPEVVEDSVYFDD